MEGNEGWTTKEISRSLPQKTESRKDVFFSGMRRGERGRVVVD